MDVSLSGKTLFITGGTGALGQTLVETALSAGARVLFTTFQNRAEAKQLQERGATPFMLDLRDHKAVLELRDRIAQEADRLDGVVFNAAVVRDHTIGKCEESEWDETLEVNLHSVFMLAKRLVPMLRKSEHGKIITVVSRVGLHGAFGQSAYAASKGALVGLTKSLAQEVGRMGIAVNAVNPGFLAAGMSEVLPEEVFKRNREESVLETFSDPQEVAKFIVYLLSDHVTRVSGQVFHFDSRKNT